MLEYILKLRQSVDKLTEIVKTNDSNLKQKLLFNIYRVSINNGIKDELMKYNYKELIDSYVSYFK